MALAVAAIAAVAVEAWHNFIWFGARSKRAEAKRNLRRLCFAQSALLTEGRPSSTWRGLDTGLEGRNRYAYFVARGGALELRSNDHRPVTPDPEATGVQVDPNVFVVGLYQVVSEADVPPLLLGGTKLGLNGTCPHCTWVLVAVGNIDVDAEYDVVSVSTGPRITSSGETVGACVAFVEHDDVPLSPIRRLFH